MPRRNYVNCFQCEREDDDGGLEVGYTRLDHDKENKRQPNRSSNSGPDGGKKAGEEEEYFRAADSYQWKASDCDQGEEPLSPCDVIIDQGSHNYTGVNMKPRRQKTKPRGFRAHLRHFVHSSWKWMKRGFFLVGPTVTSGMTLNYAASAQARRIAQKRLAKEADAPVYL